MEKTELLKYRRERRMLRSKVYMILQYAPADVDVKEVMQQHLTPAQIQEVYDDLHYFISNPKIRDKVATYCIPVSALVDAVPESSKNTHRKTKFVPFKFHKFTPHSHSQPQIPRVRPRKDNKLDV